MKSDKDVIAELLAIIRLLIQSNPTPRLEALEQWRASVEAAWPKIMGE